MRRFWAGFLESSDQLVIWGGRTAGILLLAITALIDLEILLRVFADRSLHVVEEFSGYGMAAIIFLGAGYTLLKGEHVRVQILYERLRQSGRLWLERLALVVGIVLATILLLAFFDFFMNSLRFGTRSFTVARTPMIIPHGVVVIGLFLLWLSFVTLFIRTLLPIRSQE